MKTKIICNCCRGSGKITVSICEICGERIQTNIYSDENGNEYHAKCFESGCTKIKVNDN